MAKGIYINDSIHGLIALSEYEKRIISSIGFNRLHDVYQNSTVYLTFPSNRTKRFEHSIGTMKLCSDMFYFSILNSDKQTLESFYKHYESICKSIIESISFETCSYKLGGRPPKDVNIPDVIFSQFENSLTPYNVPPEHRNLHILIIQSIRAAALLHDVGHPPFSHVVENSLKKVYEDVLLCSDRNMQKKNFATIMENYFGNDRKLHEKMGDDITESILREIIEPLSEDNVYEEARYNKALCNLICLEIVKRIFKAEEGEPFHDIHSIIDSSLDGDRLDYVTRDSLNSGINSGSIDYNRIINDMKLEFNDGKAYFCIPLKAINSVEDFIKRRYNIYKNIIYHHRVIKTDFLLENIVRKIVDNFLNFDINNESRNMDLIPFNISGLWFPLGDNTDKQKSIALSQWNDSWLMTVLKQEYYINYIECKADDSNYILSQQMLEFLRNRKVYHSIIKRSEDFKIIDDAIKVKLKEDDKILSKIDAIEKVSVGLKESNIDKSCDSTKVDIGGTLERIRTLFYKSDEQDNFSGFLLAYIQRHYESFKMSISFKELIESTVKSESKKTFTNLKHYDTITIFKDISIGLNKPIYFYDSNNKRYSLNDVSGISDILRLESDFSPIFYFYILLKNETDVIKRKKVGLLNNVGATIGTKMISNIVVMLDNILKEMEGKICVQ